MTTNRIDELSCGAIVSAEELEHLERCLSNPARPSPTILKGEALLQELRRARQLAAKRPPDGGQERK